MSNNPILLVVDDSSANRAVLFDYLNACGYRVLVAETGEAAVDIASIIAPNAILMDIMLPGIDGYAACRQIRALPKCKDTPILFMSGKDDSPSKVQGFKAGGNAYLTKPVLYDELTAHLSTHLEIQKLKQLQMDSNQTPANPRQSQSSELDAIIDMVAHDIKSPLFGIRGFSNELASEFAEFNDVPEEWIEYASIIQKSSAQIDTLLDALVLLKNPNLKKANERESLSLSELVDSVKNRYASLEGLRPLELEEALAVDAVYSEATLLEELILILLRVLCDLTQEGDDALCVRASSTAGEHGQVLFALDARTRKISAQELPYILEPIQGGKRKKVQDTSILTVCAQKIIEHLAINAWSECTENGLRVQLSLAAKE
jgi:CheY-like chemotaxis protein